MTEVNRAGRNGYHPGPMSGPLLRNASPIEPLDLIIEIV